MILTKGRHAYIVCWPVDDTSDEDAAVRPGLSIGNRDDLSSTMSIAGSSR